MSSVIINRSMTSLEIAEASGKRHDHVLRDIREMLEALDLHAPNFGGKTVVSTNNGGFRDVPIYTLPADELATLILGYDPKLRLKLVRWCRQIEAEKNAGLFHAPAPQVWITDDDLYYLVYPHKKKVPKTWPNTLGIARVFLNNIGLGQHIQAVGEDGAHRYDQIGAAAAVLSLGGKAALLLSSQEGLKAFVDRAAIAAPVVTQLNHLLPFVEEE